MPESFSRANLVTLVALLLKVGGGAGSVFFAALVSSQAVFGAYSRLFSMVIISAAIIDFGVSVRLLTVARTQTAELYGVHRRVLRRDGLLLLVLALLQAALAGMGEGLARSLPPTLLMLAASALLGGHLMSVQAHARASGNYLFELYSNGLSMSCIVAALLFLHPLREQVTVAQLLLGFVLLPRAAAFLPCLHYHFRQRPAGAEAAPAPSLRLLLPFALQGVLVAGGANLDVLAASLVMPLADVGRIKLLTTWIGLFVILPDLLANVWLNKLANASALAIQSEAFRRLFRWAALAALLFSAPFFALFLGRLDGSSAQPLGEAVLLAAVVAMRIECLAIVTVFSVTGRQTLRLISLFLASGVYWGGVLVFGHLYGFPGFFVAILLATLFQLAISVYFQRRSNPAPLAGVDVELADGVQSRP